MGFDARIVGDDQLYDTAASDVVVITAGVPRKPGMSRDDLAGDQCSLDCWLRGIRDQADAPEAAIIVVSNPLGCHGSTGLAGNRIFRPVAFWGRQAYSYRSFRAFIAMELSV